jgi:TonB-linked SusC/RagA family outer membrane protein
MRVLRQFLWATAALVILPATVTAQDPVTLSGSVQSDLGVPLASASVYIESMNLGTLTNEQGRFMLIIPASRATGEEAVVTASLIGFTTVTEVITLNPGTINLTFNLATDPLRLDEIIVTGVGLEVERAKLGVTINEVDAEELELSQEYNVVSALAGKVPNVEITTSSGDPGAGAYIRIRGANSLLGTNQPLFVVDGQPINNASRRIESSTAGTAYGNRAMDLNPNDIADIQILKGAAAAAVYGSRAANGVILITTKSGQPGTNNVSLSFNYSSDKVTSLQELQQSYGQGYGGVYVQDRNTTWGPELPSGTPVYDHAGELYQTGNRLDTNLTWSGGSDRTTYYLSLGWLDHEGVFKGNSAYERHSVRLRGGHAFRDDLRLSASISYANSHSDLIQMGSNVSGIQLGALRTPPDFNNLPYLTEDGLHRSYRRSAPTSVTQTRFYDNPFWILNEMPNTSDVSRTFGNVRVEYTPTSWLKVDYTLGGDWSADERFALFPKSSSDFPTGRMIRNDFVDFEVDHNLVVTADYDLGDWITGSVAVGQNLNQREYSRYQVNGSNLILGTDQLDFTVDQTPDEFRHKIRTDGYFIQASADLYDQFYLTAGVRYDGSNTFGEEDARYAYPKFSGAWDLSEKVADATEGLFSFAKIRAAYGVAGKQPDIYSNVSAYETGTITDGWLSPNGLYTIYSGNEGVVSEGTLGNANIKPERTTEWELGGDVAFFDNRLSLGVVYYKQDTEDAIFDVNVPPSTGFFDKSANAAQFENKGWELTTALAAINNENFQWAIEGQWATNESCVENIAGSEEFSLTGFTGSTSSAIAPIDGQCFQIGHLFGDDFIRFGTGATSDEGYDIDNQFSGWSEGDIFIGDDGYPQYDPRQRPAADPNPDWTASIRNTFTLFNNLTVTGLIDIKHGGYMWNGTKGALYYFGTHKDTEPYHGDGCMAVFGQSNPGCDSNATLSDKSVAGPGAGTSVLIDDSYMLGNIGSGFTGPFSQFVEEAGFVKLRDISVSYMVRDQDWLNRVGFSNAIISVSGRNLKTWTDYTGIDPESNLNGQGVLGRGIDYFNNPQTRSFVFGLTLNRNR